MFAYKRCASAINAFVRLVTAQANALAAAGALPPFIEYASDAVPFIEYSTDSFSVSRYQVRGPQGQTTSTTDDT